MEHGLIKRCVAGDQAAFQVLYKEYAPRVRGICVRIVGDSDADDLVQDTFLNAWRGMSNCSFENKSKFFAWLARIARNECLSRIRARNGRREVELLDILHHSDGNLSSFGRTSYGETIEHLESALSQLSQKKARVLRLRSEGYAYEEIAEIEGIVLGTVMSRLHRARRDLKAVLELESHSDETSAPIENRRIMASAGREQDKSKAARDRRFAEGFKLLVFNFWNVDSIRAASLGEVVGFQTMKRFNVGNFLRDAQKKGYLKSARKRGWYKIDKKNGRMREMVIELNVVPGPQKAAELAVDILEDDDVRPIVVEAFELILSTGVPLAAEAFESKLRELFGWCDADDDVPLYLIEMVLSELCEGDKAILKSSCITGGKKGFELITAPPADDKPDTPPAGDTAGKGEGAKMAKSSGTKGWKTLSAHNALWDWLQKEGNLNRFILAFQEEFEVAPKLARKGESMSMHHMRDKLIARLGIVEIVPPRSKLLGVVLSFLCEPEQGLFFRDNKTGSVRFGLTEKGKAIVVEARKPKGDKPNDPPPEPSKDDAKPARKSIVQLRAELQAAVEAEAERVALKLKEVLEAESELDPSDNVLVVSKLVDLLGIGDNN